MSEQSNREVDSLMIFYQEICANYRAIDDLRMRLMGLLSLASGAAILVLSSNRDFLNELDEKIGFLLVPVGLFGMLITFGLFLFELRGMQRCGALIETGKYIECLAGAPGSFLCTHHPIWICTLRDADKEGNPKIAASAKGIARVIYPTVLAAWTFVAVVKFGSALAGTLPHPSWDIPPGIAVSGEIALSSFIFFFAWSTLCIRKFESQNDKLADRLKQIDDNVVERLKGQNEAFKEQCICRYGMQRSDRSS